MDPDGAAVESRWVILQRRKVAQWGLAYAAGAFALLQGLDLVSSHFAWPAAAMRVATIASATGLPIALVLAWFHGDRGDQHVTGFELAILILLMIVGGMALRWAVAPVADPVASTAAPAPRPVIAALPLSNLGADPNFVAGLHDELVSRLSLLRGIDVVSRTSSLSLQGRGLNSRQIATALGATHLLEGSAQRMEQRVRLRLTFVDARSDRSLFTHVLDRELTDVFEIQALVASQIAETLRVRLGSDERGGLERRPTAVAEAYDAYLAARSEWSAGKLESAAQNLERAVTADPGFIDARALLAWTASRISIWRDPLDRDSRDWLGVARQHAAQLEQLAPDHPMTHLAAGVVAYWVEVDLTTARNRLERAIEAMPSEAGAVITLAWVQARLGHLEETDRLMTRLGRLDPTSGLTAEVRSMHAEFRRDYRGAIAIIERALETNPDSAALLERLAGLKFLATGDRRPLQELVEAYEGTPSGVRAQLDLLRLSDDDAKTMALAASLQETASTTRFQMRAPRALNIALLTPTQERGPLLTEADGVLDALAISSDRPNRAALSIFRAWRAALADDHAAATALLRDASQQVEAERDPMLFGSLAQLLSIGYWLAGEADSGHHWLKRCLEAYSGCHSMNVRHDVLWRPARTDPRTEPLLKSVERRLSSAALEREGPSSPGSAATSASER